MLLCYLIIRDKTFLAPVSDALVRAQATPAGGRRQRAPRDERMA
jgi:hypothetical protein